MRTAAFIAGASVLSLLLAGCAKEEEKEAEPVVPVQTAEVRTESIQRIIAGEGILRALDQSAIMPKIAAPVVTFHADRGDRVRKGQLLAVLENRDLSAAVLDNKGAYEQALANYRHVSAAAVPEEIVKSETEARAATQARDAAKKLLESREQLYRQGALARRLVDETAVTYAQAAAQSETAEKHLEALQRVSRHEEVRSAEAQVQSAKGKFEGAEAQLSYSEIHSPINGVVAERPVFPGEMANPGSPLMIVMDISSVIARVNLPQSQAAYVRVGQRARMASMDGSVETNGTVTVVSPAVDSQATTVEIWVRAANPGERLRPGATVHVTVTAETIPNAAVVPVAALLPAQQGGSAVMVVGPDSVVHEHKVELGMRDGDRVQIITGAAPGDKVVVTGGVGLQDGAKVRLQAPGEAKKQAADHE